MENSSRIHEDNQLPKIRTNKHFRIKSASKQKISALIDQFSNRGKRKSSAQQTRRIFSEGRNKQNHFGQSSIKIRIAHQELQRKFCKGNSKKVAYQSVKTDDGEPHENPFPHLRTISIEHLGIEGKKVAQLIDPRNRNIGQQETLNKQLMQQVKSKKQKEGKGKYRCRVNQFIFDQTRKKSTNNKQKETIDEFWKQVNQSLILCGNEAQQISKDLREFVDYFPTE